MSSKKEPTPVYAKASRWYIYFRSIFPILLGLGIMGYGAYELAVHKRITDSPPNSVESDDKGEIVDIKCIDQSTNPSCTMSVKYAVKGTIYRSIYTSPSSNYKTGDKVTVFVDQNNYSKIVLVGDPKTFSPWIVVVVGALFVIIPMINNYFVSKSDTLATTETIFSLASTR